MAYPAPSRSRSEVDRAGEVLAGPRDEGCAAARQVASDWRAAHAYPLLALRKLLARRAREADPDGDSLVALRRNGLLAKSRAAPRAVRRPSDKARERGISGIFRAKRNDERPEGARFGRDASPLERRVTLSIGR